MSVRPLSRVQRRSDVEMVRVNPLTPPRRPNQKGRKMPIKLQQRVERDAIGNAIVDNSRPLRHVWPDELAKSGLAAVTRTRELADQVEATALKALTKVRTIAENRDLNAAAKTRKTEAVLADLFRERDAA